MPKNWLIIAIGGGFALVAAAIIIGGQATVHLMDHMR